MPAKRTIPRICQKCGADFLAVAHKVKTGRALYCSTTCKYSRAATDAMLNPDGATATIRVRVGPGVPDVYATIDAADAEWVGQWMWSLNIGGYVVRPRRNGEQGPRRVFLHREVLGLAQGVGLEGDHISRDKLDNRRRNLRPATRTQNAQNVSSSRESSSRYRGVSWYKKLGKWHAQVRVGDKNHHFGYFTDEHEAAEAAQSGRMSLMPFAVD